MNYWLHRVSHENGYDILRNECRLTIGFSSVRKCPAACEALSKKDRAAFNCAYAGVYKGEIERLKNGLWRFVAEMQVGDIVVVPCPGGLWLCEIKGDAEPCMQFDGNRERDLGWQREVKIVGDSVRSPRQSYATAPLLSRMKCRQTNLDIGDLKVEVEDLRRRIVDNQPLDFVKELYESCLKLMKLHGLPEKLELLVCDYLNALGGVARVLPKNGDDKSGDCDVEAVFEQLRLTISVQCKRHKGMTDENAVRQIADYAAGHITDEKEENWTYAQWVISTADDFTDEAKRLAAEKGVVLINGPEFAHGLIRAGVRN